MGVLRSDGDMRTGLIGAILHEIFVDGGAVQGADEVVAGIDHEHISVIRDYREHPAGRGHRRWRRCGLHLRADTLKEILLAEQPLEDEPAPISTRGRPGRTWTGSSRSPGS